MMKQVFKGKLLNLFIKKRTLPNGYKATFEMVKHPGAALIIPFLTNDKIILLRQLRPVVGAYIYELPAGTLDKGERPLECARREIIEETGYSAGRFKLLGKIYPVPGYSTERIYIYTARGLKKAKRVAEADEIIESCVFSRNQIRALFRAGEIEDAKTISALAMCEVL